MTDSDGTVRYAFARSVAAEAGQRALAWHADRAALGATEKTRGDWVTRADTDVEAFIRSRITETFPDDRIVGEEEGADGPLTEADGAGTWIIDPIDGTANFVSGLPFWCVCLGYMKGTRFTMGVIDDPLHQNQFHGLRGQGAFRTGRDGRGEMLRVSAQQGLEYATVGYAHQRKRPVTFSTRAYLNVSDAHGGFRALGSGALHLAHVASGALDGFFESRIHLWDIAAAVPLIEEAGGFITAPFNPADPTAAFPVVAGAPGVRAGLEAATAHFFQDE